MTITKDHIKIGLLLVVCIILTVLVIGMFRRSTAPADTAPAVELYERLLKAEQEKAALAIKQRDEVLAEWRRSDSIMQLRYKSNSVRYEKVPVLVNDFTRDQLRRAYADY